MIAAVDDGEDGEIGLSEFLQLMAEQMQSTPQDEELIAAFKLFGANSSEDVISFEKLKDTLSGMGSLEEFKDDELQLIFGEVAGASQRTSGDNGSGESVGISLTDFMLMMMAKLI